MGPSKKLFVEDVTRDYLQKLEELLKGIDSAAIERVFLTLCSARDKGAMIFVAGNGGSAATAIHWVNDLAKAVKRSGRASTRAMSLVDNVSLLTALANDEGYDRVFAGQLENFARPGDVLVVISASGNSTNLIRAVEFAEKKNLITIGLLGFDGGALKAKVKECLWIPSEKGAYELVEDCHMILCNILTKCLAQDHPHAAS